MSDKKESKLQEMAVRGKEFRDEYDFELYGEEVTAIIRPLDDDEFLPLAAILAEKFDVDADEIDAQAGESVAEASDAVDEATVGESVDMSQLDEDFVKVVQKAAALGLVGSYTEEGDEVNIDNETAEEIVGDLKGGHSVELGMEVLNISGNIEDAEKFR